MFDPRKAVQSYKGTALYMAPEKNHSQKKADIEKVDIYSLGVMIYQLFTGTFPTLQVD